MANTGLKYTTKPPTLAAFLVGDAIGFVPKPWPRAKFKEALVDTLQCFGDPWVICECIEPPQLYQDQDDAENHGWLAVTEMVMEARTELNEMQNSKLKRKPCKPCNDIHGNNADQNIEVENVLPKKWEDAKNDDDPNTFCLVGIDKDNIPLVLSKQRKLPEEFKLLPEKVKKDRCKTVHDTMLYLQEELSKTMTSALKLDENVGKEFKMQIPTIVVVVEGDLDTIKHVAEAVQKNIPVLLVRGSGMAADLIGYCLENEDVLETRAPLLFGTCFSEESFNELEKDIKIIQRNKGKLSEFNISTESVTSLKDKVTESVIRTWAMAHVKGGKKAAQFAAASPAASTSDYQPNKGHLNLPNGQNVPPPATYSDESKTHPQRRHSKIWPMVSISHEAVRPRSSRQHAQYLQRSASDPNDKHTCVPHYEKRNVKPSPLAIYMLYQILQTNQSLVTEDSVEGRSSGSSKELQKSGQTLLRYALRENLYEVTELLVDKGVKLPWKTERSWENGKKVAADGMSLYEEILGEREERQDDQTKTCIADIIELVKIPDRKEGIWTIGCEIISYNIEEDTKENNKDLNRNLMTPSDLLLWAVLTNKKEMAELFWKRSREPILTALIASAILRKMSRRAHSFKEEVMEEELLLHSRVFRQRAIDVTQHFYDNHEREAVFVLERENNKSVWGIKESALEFSQEHKIHEFVAHHVPQRTFHRIWYGGDFFRGKDIYKKKKRNVFCCKWRFHSNWAFFTSPVTKFTIHYLFFCLFLVCLSSFVMTNIRSKKWPIDEKTIYEYCTYLWLFADIVEEYVPPAVYTIGQYLHQLQWRRRAWNHMHNFWNGMDALSYVVLITGICFRFGYETTDFGISRRFYSIGLFLMFMRFLHVLLIWRKIGPTVIMLKEGLKELLRFVSIMVVFVLSAGVFYHANLYPNHFDMFSTFGMRYWSVWKIIYYPYWSIYGEFKSEIEGEDSTGTCSFNETIYMNDPDIERCPESDWMVSLMSGFFVLILNLLLVNLIIAMFSFRFEQIKKNSDQFWRFHRSQVIMEFRGRIPVPLNLVVWPVKIAIHCFKRKKKNKKNTKAIEAREKLDGKQQILARRWMLSESDARNFRAND